MHNKHNNSISHATIISLVDLTLLDDHSDKKAIQQLCDDALKNPIAPTAAICIFKSFIPHAKKTLASDMPIATVANFPKGDGSIESVVAEVKQAVAIGADEIDIVIPYHDYLEKGQSQNACQLVAVCKEACQGKVLKVIIESGALEQDALIYQASVDAINNGADFIKTSTGKSEKGGATLQAVEVMLQAIANTNNSVGLKVSGGVHTVSQACEYIQKASEKMGQNYIHPSTFRLGASRLLSNVIKEA